MRAIFLTLSLLAAIALLTPTEALAQENTSLSDSLITKANLKDNTVFWHQGQLVMHRGGKLFSVQDTVRFGNGTLVVPDGHLLTAGGKTMLLKQKHAISPQGRVVLVADDIFTLDTIIEHERQIVGDTETRLVVIDGKLAQLATGKEKQIYSIGQEKRIQLLEEMIRLLEERANLLEKSMTPAERKSIDVYYLGLNKRIQNVDNQLKALAPSVK